ncbi:MAG: IS5 family transposase [Paucibacter sp.]|nr:IS5 family transposase [Roseateles sp.]
MFRTELVNLIDQRHELVKLAGLIDWQAFADEWSPQFTSTTGRPALPTRLMAALLYLKHAFALSDEDVVQRWCENLYWQHFSGERYFRHELPCDPSSLVRWRQRIGEEGCEWLLAQTIEAARSAGLVKRQSLEAIVLDTTVQPKAIAHPTDSRLLDRAREQLADEAKRVGITLRQSYSRVGKHASQKAGRYAHAKQYKRMGREIRKLRTWLGRVIRDVERKAAGGEFGGRLKQRLEIARRLHAQKRDSKNKLYALHAPEVECLAKGKARTPYEFGVKVSVAVTAKEGLVVGMRSMPGNPYDGHTVDSQLEQVSILTGHTPKIVLADRGYRGVETPTGTRLLISHTRRLPARLKRLLKRRQVVEPMIGHMKADGLLDRNWLKGADGDALHALLCGAGHNLRMLLRYLRVLCLALLAWLHRFSLPPPSINSPSSASAPV